MPAVEIDLRPLAGRIATRSAFLTTAAQRMIAAVKFDFEDVEYRERYIPFVARGYFLLSEAYKLKRGLDGLTQTPKIAAFTSLALSTIAPFRSRQDEPRRATTLCANEIFGLLCARRQLRSDLAFVTPTMRDRAYAAMRVQSMKCLEPLWADGRMLLKRWDYAIDIDLDLAEIDGQILMFELMAGLEATHASSLRLQAANTILEDRNRQLRGPMP
jgi:hypothetical protein